MRARLWPHADAAELRHEADEFVDAGAASLIAAAFVAEEGAAARGFIELSLRPFSEGCTSSPVPHVEGWYVEPEVRDRGIGRALMAEAEQWARDGGYVELASDTQLDNDESLRAHAACGFDEVERLVKLRRSLR